MKLKVYEMGVRVSFDPSRSLAAIMRIDPLIQSFGYPDIKRVVECKQDIHVVHRYLISMTTIDLEALRLARLAQDHSTRALMPGLFAVHLLRMAARSVVMSEASAESNASVRVRICPKILAITSALLRPQVSESVDHSEVDRTLDQAGAAQE